MFHFKILKETVEYLKHEAADKNGQMKVSM